MLIIGPITDHLSPLLPFVRPINRSINQSISQLRQSVQHQSIASFNEYKTREGRIKWSDRHSLRQTLSNQSHLYAVILVFHCFVRYSPTYSSTLSVFVFKHIAISSAERSQAESSACAVIYLSSALTRYHLLLSLYIFLFVWHRIECHTHGSFSGRTVDWGSLHS